MNIDSGTGLHGFLRPRGGCGRGRARMGDAALDEVSRQFESLFLQMMLKSMRDASLGGGLMDSKQSEFYRDMYDKQIAVDMAQKQGIGLADVLKRQLGGGISAQYSDLHPEEYLGMPITARPVNGADAATVARRSVDTQRRSMVRRRPLSTPCGRWLNRRLRRSICHRRHCWRRPHWRPAGDVM